MVTNLSILKNRKLLVIGLSESVSNVGNWITMMAIFAMLVFKGDGGVAASSGVFLAGMLPLLLFSPAAGWMADRFDRKQLMIASELLAGASIAGLIFITRIEWIYALIALQAICTSWMTPARQAVVPSIVSEEELPRANAFLQQLNGVIKIFAPVIAGGILAVMNPHRAIILDVISFGLSALILSRLPAMPPPAKGAEKSSASPQTRKISFAALLRDLPMLRLLFMGLFLSIFVIIGFDVLAPVFIRDTLGGSEGLFGVAISLVGAGTLVSTLYLMLRKSRSGYAWPDMQMGLAIFTIIPLTLAASFWVGDPQTGKLMMMAGCLVGGFGNGLVAVQGGTLLQQLAPREYLGRAAGLFQGTAVAGQLCGMLLTPVLVPGILNMEYYFLISAVLLALLVVYMGLSLRGMRAAVQLPSAGED